MQSVKVVVTGPFNAGKTTFIKSVSEITVLSTERQVSDVSGEGGGETTVAMDFGRITISDDVVLYLFGTPGQERFSFMWETLSEGMLGFVLMVDVTSEESVSDAASMIKFFTGMSDVPFVVAANKVDPSNDAILSSIRAALELADDVPLLPCNACDKDSVKAVLLGLLYRILDSMR
ncbi:MAG: ATP/GTP-binding protein [Actinomycetota bacterium]|jgi:small GTP-binding protein|nr:MAG: small GTP-binding [Actinomycetota bacterium]MDO8949323.1 ATP/GTP-binding protein [Actinomycetota bacterium]MDP3630697.1 ATP/GTP-binding protein [Actinomycetota bacterium]